MRHRRQVGASLVTVEGFIQLQTRLPYTTINRHGGRGPHMTVGNLRARLDSHRGVHGCEVTVTGAYAFQPNWLKLLDDFAQAETRSIFRYYEYPLELHQLVEQARLELRQAAQSMIALVRWRFDGSTWRGDSTRIGGSRLSWSADGENWGKLDTGLEATSAIFPEPAHLIDASQALKDLTGTQEPLGREIWHAAAGAHDRGDPRTAIILSVSAVEIELKRFIGEAVPEAEWLVMNLQAPPIVVMIQKYLPTLRGFEPAYRPPKKLIRTLEEGVAKRNTLVHVGTKTDERIPVTIDESWAVLDASSDLLWLLDVYRGHRWALEHLNLATRKALGLENLP